MTTSTCHGRRSESRTSTAPQKDHEYRHIGKSLYLARPKSKAGWRTPPLVPELAELLRREIGDRKDGLVFLRDGEPWDPADASKEWKVILAGAGVNEKSASSTAHDTRRLGCCTNWGSVKQRSSRSYGHSTVSVTRRYGQAGNKRAIHDAIAKLSTALSGRAIESLLNKNEPRRSSCRGFSFIGYAKSCASQGLAILVSGNEACRLISCTPFAGCLAV